MKAIILQHVPFEGPGYILSWLHEKGFATDIYSVCNPEIPTPDVCSANLLIVLGGPMSVNDEKTYPWLIEEKKLIKKAIDHNIPTLGICLGSQLIASVCGAKISRASEKEIGWFPVQAVPQTSKNKKNFSFPESFISFHWHSEQFDIPINATKIATNSVNPNQAFQIGKTVIGLQFHPEITPYSLQTMVNHTPIELTNESYVQPAQQLLSVPTEYFIQNHRLVDKLLSYLLSKGKTKNSRHG
ncbi:hypothetical protein COMNV_01518 [Commensalibacter sp. Nvir]|uniref:type 1 glutamine amidotransferase n=1 Tax=Commensalibacter sp. Nvir TaxID=3069817 RepID=UPI002D5A776B|nr:hypothetical protein COMNV_01518 [Commensalibacter sp. Nvir]